MPGFSFTLFRLPRRAAFRLSCRVALWLVGLLLLSASGAPPAGAQTTNVTVAGTSDIWLAGMPDGSMASFVDVAPFQSPVLVTGIPILPGNYITFAASGMTSNGGFPLFGPEGDTDPFSITNHWSGAENGMSDILSPIDALIGVFLGPGIPTLLPPPGSLDFSTDTDRDFASLSPELQQVFFIGDGLTSLSAVQKFYVPAGATRLFLGTMDGFDWGNNPGSFNVDATVGPASVVPEGNGLLMLGTGLLSIGFLLQRRQKASTRA